MIGFGFIGSRGHAPTYASEESTKIVAVADGCAEQRRLAEQLLPGVRVYPDAESLLAAERDRLDFVDIATPPNDHARVAHMALDRGLHVLCEKPLAATPEDARAMLDHARAARRVIFPCHNYKHAPVVKAVRDVLAAGTIGPVNLVTLQTFRNTHAKGVSSWRPDWWRERAVAGGGIAMDHGSHTFYLAFEWMNAYPTGISAHAATHGPYDTEDNFSCTLKFPHGTATAHLSWTSGTRKVIYTIHGTRGAIRVDDEDIEIATLQAGPGVEAPGSPGRWRLDNRQAPSDWMDASHKGWFASLLGEFRRAISERDYVGKDAREALLCVELIHRGYESARKGCQMVRIGSIDAPTALSAGSLGRERAEVA